MIQILVLLSLKLVRYLQVYRSNHSGDWIEQVYCEPELSKQGFPSTDVTGPRSIGGLAGTS